jgi:hypothetical protein
MQIRQPAATFRKTPLEGASLLTTSFALDAPICVTTRNYTAFDVQYGQRKHVERVYGMGRVVSVTSPSEIARALALIGASVCGAPTACNL